jgi:hypothetical protein
MKKNLFLLMMIAFVATMTMTSCGSADPCKDVECGQSAATPTGACFEGECQCNVGFDGIACADEWATKFVGNYTGDDTFVTTPVDPDFPDGKYTLPASEPVKIEKASGTEVNIISLGNFTSTSFKVPVSLATDNAKEALKIVCTDLAGYAASSTVKLTMDATYDSTAKTLKGTYTLIFPDGSKSASTFNYVK